MDTVRKLLYIDLYQKHGGQTEAGLEDFRGVALTETIQYMAIQQVDLSYARFVDSASLNTSAFTDCRFDGVKLDRRYVTQHFSRCSFREANLSQARISKRFEDCDFTGCQFRRAIASDVSFIRCRFDGTQFRGAMLMHCQFEACSFDGAVLHGGSWAESRFTGDADSLPDWGNTILDGVKINGNALR